ncbi:MAG: hypothetical protein QOI47_1608 [Actinomycetota bacterium]|nr:hypothetical protein [Actinomycetota bacterium]
MADHLDNVVWSSIVGPRSALAETHGSAGRFHPDVAPFAAVRDPTSARAWADLAVLVEPGRQATLFLPAAFEVPGGWTELRRLPCFQLVADGVDVAAAEDGFLALGAADVPDMLELVAATRPGPFVARTVDFGGYLGVRVDDRLVAMAGERLRVDGFTELSAVCTVPELRGTGLATRLMLAVIARIRARDEEAFLHVLTDNASAVRLYRAMGFSERCLTDAVVVEQAP